MRTAWLLAIVLSACITTGDQRTAEATWSIVQLDGTVVGCPVSWDTTRLVMTDAAHPDARVVDEFRCSAGAGQSSHLPASSYTASLEFLDASGRVVATSLPQTVEVQPLGVSFASKVYVDAGFITLSWSFADPKGACPDGFDPFVDIALSLSGPKSETALFGCDDLTGIVGPLPPGTYHAWLGQGVQGHDIPDITVTAPNGVTDVGHHMF